MSGRQQSNTLHAMTTLRTLALTASALAALLAPAASADAAKPTRWKVVEATHTSSATHQSEAGTGSGSMTWSMIAPKSTAPNRLTLSASNSPIVAGYGVVNAAGTFRTSASTEKGSCDMTAATGDPEHGIEAPGLFQLNIGKAPEGGVQAAIDAPYARVGSGFFGSECRLGGEPMPLKAMQVTRFPQSHLRRKKLVLVWKGSAAAEGDSWTWSTRIVLKRR